MLANAMFYKVDDKSSSGTSVHIGPISFSVKQLSIAIQSSMVVLPANILIVTMFRKARPAEPKKDGLDKDQDPHGKSGKYEFDADAGGKEEPPKSDDDEKADDSGGPKKKKKFTLPHYFVYVAYALAFVAASTTAAFTVFYGLTFGKEKSEKWMSTMMLSFWQDVLISQPLKVCTAVCSVQDLQFPRRPHYINHLVPFRRSVGHLKNKQTNEPPKIRSGYVLTFNPFTPKFEKYILTTFYGEMYKWWNENLVVKWLKS